jgi:hypothetical protein
VTFLVPDLVKLRARNETCNILVLKCLGFTESNIIVIMTPRPIVNLRSSLGIMP